MIEKVIFESPRATLSRVDKRDPASGRQSHYFTVRVAAQPYGPFSWAEALSWYRRHKA